MRPFLLSLFLCVGVIGWGQSTSSSSGVITNTYHAVVAKGTDNASLVVDNVTGLKDWDKVMIIQMKGGVTMETSNGTQFGAVSNYGNVGNYEIATICKVDQTTKTIYFLNEFGATYDFGEGKGGKATEMGRIQVVKIPVYESFTVTGLSSPPAWDSTTGKGGVLAIIVEDDLILGANISTDGKGFIGGKFEQSDKQCEFLDLNNFFYDPRSKTPQMGAYKGESIFRISLSIAGGKGANANGGGGGNNHNNGGGGGANLSNGGIGGGNSSTGFFCTNSDRGFGGNGITVGSKSKIFMGGGGGAGHVNNALIYPQVGGGNGGGIIFIQAGRLTSNGHSISANGLKGGDQQGDGAGGGGAGGTIIMNTTSYADAVNIEAKGGAGGNVDNENISGSCYPEGGGGSGGVVYFKTPKPIQGIVSVAGGTKGVQTLTKGCRTPIIVGGDGLAGTVSDGYSYSVTGAISKNCPDASSLPVKLVYFKATNKGPQVTAEWKVENPEDGLEYIVQRRDGNGLWQSIQTTPAEEHTTTYQKSDGPLATGIYLYRLKIVEKDRTVSYSPIQQVTIKAEDLNRLTVHPNPATSEITIVTPLSGEEWLNIYDMKSRLVYRKKVVPSNAVIRQDVSFLSEGVYMIQVGKLTARFVVFK